MSHFTQASTQEELKSQYRNLAKEWHPDLNPGKPDALRMMQEINAEYAAAAARSSFYGAKDRAAKAHAEGRKVNTDYVDLDQVREDLRRIIEELLNISPDLDIEIAGLWVWVGGDTKPHYKAIKALGLRWCKNKGECGLWAYAGVKSFGRGNWSMDDIRGTYGSAKVYKEEKQTRPMLAA